MTTTTAQALAEFVLELKEPHPQQLGPGVARRFDGSMLVPELQGQVVEVDEETYWYYLEALPPHYFDGRDFCFAEGFMSFVFFFVRRGRYFARKLTEAETQKFCLLAEIASPGRG